MEQITIFFKIITFIGLLFFLREIILWWNGIYRIMDELEEIKKILGDKKL